ncbi:RNA polymerase sigma subunit RpoS (sigma-38) [Salmonella enterica subsp. enterica serovar Typhi]|nr:RNA polymerase sigma subunit RpoS (sigma-38) [Salmonella enterica subsp. enterica serovar Typhi]CFX57852.1 RNA polymerase sigma subunit RpoS (sigma-38) [Salmonella enterica subsp. enterica serovar Typhi]CGO96188.1 RNA polymerase sigma subunit RpoS (sigma-38) [Salmonella enterica subsp. enterica serovar Typhi]
MSQNTLKVHDLNEDAEFDENGVEAFDEKALSEEEPSDNDLAEEELLSQGATQRVLDATQLYLGEIGYSPLLTAEEEVYMAACIERGAAVFIGGDDPVSSARSGGRRHAGLSAVMAFLGYACAGLYYR